MFTPKALHLNSLLKVFLYLNTPELHTTCGFSGFFFTFYRLHTYYQVKKLWVCSGFTPTNSTLMVLSLHIRLISSSWATYSDPFSNKDTRIRWTNDETNGGKKSTQFKIPFPCWLLKIIECTSQMKVLPSPPKTWYGTYVHIMIQGSVEESRLEVKGGE